MDTLLLDATKFITLTPENITFLFIVGFIGGLVSGFIGSGGAFVLTPGMMSLGVPGTVAVASNMCHKFPKALVGAIKRFKYGQVDIKLGLVMAASAGVGVQVGIMLQNAILSRWGQAGSDLYVSLSFVAVLVIVGGYILRDAVTSSRRGGEETVAPLARRLQAIELWPMMTFKTAGMRISFWFTVPVGFATGMLAATIAVGGFIGVPGMIYVLGASSLVGSATELVVAFVMGLFGSINWAMQGMVDIRLVLIILGGSLLGVQLGAIGTTYVREHMIKVVMATIMLVVAVSRGIAVPKYLAKLGLMDISESTLWIMDKASFVIMCAALMIGAVIILGSMWKAKRAERGEALGNA
ncbi:sulfite exporter TauE/SafE family protein [Desulfovibrio sulfodismutans]|uniref:Probable membrane transporter protein n=1 Tax=Desulfolutivibrio sulfodismutans TaxID=63561 RepID=A0A7K3NHW4_9BACT|nr:sulfite exporter TauE/SafE family protein [Desulfolutivibrio sulfodismutans]NDY55786.1 sulfite exporter TauE/SafE family protein [Desulfolutivibrio sulfodismutans]QLA13403.1 TSUP family transporter [Desulfolutivibrio sulfodismutans DSM 3696]